VQVGRNGLAGIGLRREVLGGGKTGPAIQRIRWRFSVFESGVLLVRTPGGAKL